MSSISRYPTPIATSAVVLFLILSQGAWAASKTSEPVRVDVFTAQDLPLQKENPDDPLSVPKMIEVYVIDGIQRFEAILSDQLPTDPDAARQIAFERVGQVDSPWIEAAQRAALGLLKAVEYGVDRYPAIVFDGRTVVYGVTDMGEALRHFRVWQGRATR